MFIPTFSRQNRDLSKGESKNAPNALDISPSVEKKKICKIFIFLIHSSNQFWVALP